MAAGLTLAPSGGSAQQQEVRDRFFADRIPEESDTVYQGRLTSSTFAYQELGDSVFRNIMNVGDVEVADNASPSARIYTELRAQLGMTQPGVHRIDLRADARVRIALPCEFEYANNTDEETDQTDLGRLGYDTCQSQSGTYGGNEYDIRELYGKRAGEVELQAGRQYVMEAAATRLDGVKAAYALDGNWSLIGFGGLAPSRISRSLTDDYYGGVLPIAAGAAGAYRYARYFGSVGAAGIVPLVTSDANASVEPRIFVSSNGYWRPSELLDVYHVVTVDLAGSSTEELSDRFTNVSVGANIKPVEDLRLTATLHHFSTDTLDEFARQRLDDAAENDIVQNNVDVLRLSAQAARLGVSLAMMEQRFEVSTSFQLRHRPPQSVCLGSDADCTSTEANLTRDAWSGEAMLSVVDRRSVGGLRLGASLINMFGLYDALGLGEESYGRSNHLVARLDASRELMNEQMQIDADVSYLHAEDIGDSTCMNPSPAALSCFGRSLVNTVSGGATVYYRFSPDWFALVTANVALQNFTPNGLNDPNAIAYSNTLLTGFLRLAYRF